MTFTLGFYDLFAYSVPGFLYMSIFGFIATRMDWVAVDLKDIKNVPSLLVVLALAIASYVIGHVTWPLARFSGALFNRLRPEGDAAAIFRERESNVVSQLELRHSRFLLQAKVELASREVASEITRMRAIGLMLRNSTVPLFLGFICAVVELVVGRQPLFAAVVAILLLLAVFGAATQSRRLSLWSVLKTYELAYWSLADDTSSSAKGGD